MFSGLCNSSQLRSMSGRARTHTIVLRLTMFSTFQLLGVFLPSSSTNKRHKDEKQNTRFDLSDAVCYGVCCWDSPYDSMGLVSLTPTFTVRCPSPMQPCTLANGSRYFCADDRTQDGQDGLQQLRLQEFFQRL